MGQKSAMIRPIVAKFHYFTDSEKVRKTSFDYTNELRAANLGIGAQVPKEIRDARKPLYPAMKKMTMEKNVKFVEKKLLINGAEYDAGE